MLHQEEENSNKLCIVVKRTAAGENTRIVIFIQHKPKSHVKTKEKLIIQITKKNQSKDIQTKKTVNQRQTNERKKIAGTQNK